MCLLFSKILYTYLQCALVSRKTESAFFIEIFAYRWTNAEKMSVVKCKRIFQNAVQHWRDYMSVVN